LRFRFFIQHGCLPAQRLARVAGFLRCNSQELVLGYELEAVRRIATGDFEINEKISDSDRVGDEYRTRTAVLFGQIKGWIYFLAVLAQEAGAGTAERETMAPGVVWRL
jgi:hypothetical protein